MMALSEEIASEPLSQAQAAAQRLEVTQPRISYLMRGKIHLFSLDAFEDSRLNRRSFLSTRRVGPCSR